MTWNPKRAWPLGLLALLLSTTAQAQDGGHTHSTLNLPHGDDGEVVTLEAAYTGDIWYNTGGDGDGWRYLDNLDLAATVDLQSLLGWQGATAFGYLLYNNGASLNALSGDAFVVSNIESGTRALRLYELWVEAPLAEGVTAKVGLYDLNSEFDVLDSSALFIGSAHGIGVDISQSGENGPSIFPSTSFSVRLQVDLAPNVVWRTAILDGVPGNPDKPSATAIRLGNGDGVMAITELGYGDADGRVLIGAWGYSAQSDTHDGVETKSNRGAYVRGEVKLGEMGTTTAHGFARFGVADGRVNTFDQFVSAGVNLGFEDGHAAGLAIAHGSTSPHWRAANVGGGKGETVVEATYAHALTPWLSLQPNVQYVIDPSADPSKKQCLGRRNPVYAKSLDGCNV